MTVMTTIMSAHAPAHTLATHQSIDDDTPEYPAGVPSKFAPDGTVQPFPGNTVIAHVSPESPLYASLMALHRKLAASEYAPFLALLPPDSWHMTIFEGVCDQVRGRGYWPAHIETLKYCTSLFATRLRNARLEDARPPLRLKITGFDPLETGVGVSVEGRGPREDRRIRDLRDRLADVLEIKHPNHARYGFHISIAYLLRHLSDEQEVGLTALLMQHWETVPKEFDLGAPEFCTFENMHSFHRLFYLGEDSGHARNSSSGSVY
jgi:hypothetical protein